MRTRPWRRTERDGFYWLLPEQLTKPVVADHLLTVSQVVQTRDAAVPTQPVNATNDSVVQCRELDGDGDDDITAEMGLIL